jgi:iron complex outermembrane receptor protein
VRLQHGWRTSDVLSLSAFVEPKTIHRAERNRFRDFTRYHTGGSASHRWKLPGAPELNLRWTNGVDEAFQDGTVLFYDLGPNGSRGTNLAANKREAINTLGFFSQLEASPAPKLEVSAGARYDLVRFIFEDFTTPALGDRRTMNRVSPRVALSYRVRPGQSAFLAFSSGIEAPAYNEIDPPAPFDAVTGLNPFLKPAHSFTLEVGTKGTQTLRTDGKSYLRYDVALYGLEVRNDIIPYDGGVYYTTAGNSRRMGIEAGGELHLANGMYSRLACSVSRNRYVDYTNLLGTFDDNRSAGISPFVLDAKAGYEARYGAFVEAAVHALGTYYADDANTNRVPAYGVADLMLGARRTLGGGQLEGFAGCDNLFDEKYVASVFINGAGGRFIEPGMARSFLFGLRYRGN